MHCREDTTDKKKPETFSFELHLVHCHVNKSRKRNGYEKVNDRFVEYESGGRRAGP